MKKSLRSVPSTQLVRDLPSVKQMLETGPVQITSHGRDEFVMVGNEDFGAMQNLVGVDAERLEGKLTTVLESIETLVLLTDQDLNIRRANRAFCDYFDYDAMTLIGSPLSELLHTPTDQYLYHRIKFVLHSGVTERFELPSSHRSNRFFSHLITPWPNGVAFFSHDVTDRTDARDLELAISAQQTAIRGLNRTAVANIDPHGKFLSSSTSLQALLDSSAEQIQGASVLSLIHASDRPTVQEMLVFTDEPVKSADIQYLYRGTELHRARISLSPFQTTHNHLQFAMALQDLELTG